MRTRIIGPAEYGLLTETELPPLLQYINPKNVAVVVVEEEEKVIACLATLQATHFEGLWIAPEHRGNAGVTRALLRQATAIAKTHGDVWAFGGAADERMRGFMGRIGVQIPMDLYALWIGEK